MFYSCNIYTPLLLVFFFIFLLYLYHIIVTKNTVKIISNFVINGKFHNVVFTAPSGVYFLGIARY